MRVLVTGAKGQVGSEVVQWFELSGHHVVALDSTALDICAPVAVRQQLEQFQPLHAVINCAAYTAVDRAEDEPERAFLVNVTGVENLAHTCRDLNIPLVHFSTDYVFDGNKSAAYTEEDPPNPLSVYGKSKWQGEDRLRQIWHKHYILRVSWVFGSVGNNFVKTILKLAKDRPELKIVDDQQGCPTGAQHIAQVVLAILMHPKAGNSFGTYHYTDQSVTSWCQFAQFFLLLAYERQLLATLPVITSIPTSQYPTKAKRPLNSVLNCDKIQRTFAIKPYAWREEVERLLTHYFT